MVDDDQKTASDWAKERNFNEGERAERSGAGGGGGLRKTSLRASERSEQQAIRG